MLKNEALFLPEGLLAVIITTMIVSLCTSMYIGKLHADRITDRVRVRISEYEQNAFSKWEGCSQCMAEETDF